MLQQDVSIGWESIVDQPSLLKQCLKEVLDPFLPRIVFLVQLQFREVNNVGSLEVVPLLL